MLVTGHVEILKRALVLYISRYDSVWEFDMSDCFSGNKNQKSRRKLYSAIKNGVKAPDMMCEDFRIDEKGRIYLPYHHLCIGRAMPWVWTKNVNYSAFDEHAGRLRFLHSMAPEANLSLYEAQRYIVEMLLNLYDKAIVAESAEDAAYALGCILHAVADSYSPGHTKRMSESEVEEYITSLKARRLFSSNICTRTEDDTDIGKTSRKMFEREKEVASMYILFRMTELVQEGKVKLSSNENELFERFTKILWDDPDFQTRFSGQKKQVEKYMKEHRKSLIKIMEERIFFEEMMKDYVSYERKVEEPSDHPYIVALQYFDLQSSLMTHNAYDRLRIAQEMGLLDWAVRDTCDILRMFADHKTKKMERKQCLFELATYLYRNTYRIPKALKDFYAARLIRYNTFGMKDGNPFIHLFAKGAHTWIEDKSRC